MFASVCKHSKIFTDPATTVLNLNLSHLLKIDWHITMLNGRVVSQQQGLLTLSSCLHLIIPVREPPVGTKCKPGRRCIAPAAIPTKPREIVCARWRTSYTAVTSNLLIPGRLETATLFGICLKHFHTLQDCAWVIFNNGYAARGQSCTRTTLPLLQSFAAAAVTSFRVTEWRSWVSPCARELPGASPRHNYTTKLKKVAEV